MGVLRTAGIVAQERLQPPFPDQMLSYCTKREHCLITSTQLLGMVLGSREKKEKGAAYLEKIFSTVGVFDGFSDYKMFLMEETPGEGTPVKQDSTQLPISTQAAFR
jgi:hypothetical protein